MPESKISLPAMKNIELHLGDCLEVMKGIPDGSVDCVITDPPYGIAKKWDGQMVGKNGKSRLWCKGANEWDYLINPDFINNLTNYPCIIWGGNYYPLPPTRSWLIWDKVQMFSGADFEMAWTNIDCTPKIFRMSRIDAYVNDIQTKKSHPTEKPLGLMRWCIENYTEEGQTILDPFMGSGTTGVACVQTGRKFIGIEKEESYFEIAKKRIEGAQLPLFT